NRTNNTHDPHAIDANDDARAKPAGDGNRRQEWEEKANRHSTSPKEMNGECNRRKEHQDEREKTFRQWAQHATQRHRDRALVERMPETLEHFLGRLVERCFERLTVAHADDDAVVWCFVRDVDTIAPEAPVLAWRAYENAVVFEGDLSVLSPPF